MENSKTVLVAGVSGSVALLAAAGKSAGVRAISGCILQLRSVAQSCGGNLIQDLGDKVMVLFDTPDTAAAAASRMHAVVDALAPIAGVKLAAQVGFHSGPVVERDGDVLGDTVQLAVKLVREAQRGQTITSQHTAALLSTPPTGSRQLYVLPLGRQGGDLRLYEVTSQPQAGAHLPRAREVLQLKYRNALISCERTNPRILIGRDMRCALVIRDQLASRRHCTIELREDGFELRDHSTNGTYVTNEGSREAMLQGARLPLAIHGWVALGLPRALAAQGIEFSGH